MIKWMINRLGYQAKKSLALYILEDILNSSDSNIDNKVAEQIITTVIKSKGNKVSSFILKD